MNKKMVGASMLAGVVMAMLVMVYEGLFGAGFWSAPLFIAATVLRDLQMVAVPVSFMFVPVVVGLIGHMMNSLVFSSIFFFTLRKKPVSIHKGVFLGVVHALAIFFLMEFVLLQYIDPVMLTLDSYMFAFSHIVWGAILGAAASQLNK